MGYAWTPNLRSFEKIHEVRVSPYLGFILYLSVFQCFGKLEALNGRLISPKTWDRIDIIFETKNGAAVTVHADLGGLIAHLCVDACIGLYEAGNGRETRIHRVNL